MSLPGALVGALLGLGVEIAIRELTGIDVIDGFRCRVLAGRHDRRIQSIERRMKRLERPRWFLPKRARMPSENYERALVLERRARALFDQYERELKEI